MVNNEHTHDPVEKVCIGYHGNEDTDFLRMRLEGGDIERGLSHQLTPIITSKTPAHCTGRE